MPRNSFQRPQRTLTDICNEMDMLLYQATDEAFARLTLDGLQRRYSRLRPAVVAKHFADAQAARGALAGRLL